MGHHRSFKPVIQRFHDGHITVTDYRDIIKRL